MKLPPPTNAFNAPAIPAATSKKIAWSKCKSIEGMKREARDAMSGSEPDWATIYQEFSPDPEFIPGVLSALKYALSKSLNVI